MTTEKEALDLALTEDERYIRLGRIGFICSFFQHALFCLIFYLLEVPYLPQYNLLSITLFLFAYIFNEKGHFYIALTIAYFEVTVHQTLATLILGWDTGFYLYLIFNIALPLLTKRGHIIWKSFIISTTTLTFLYLLFYHRTTVPYFPLSDAVSGVFTIVNTLSFLMILVLMVEGFNRTVLGYEEKLNKEITYANSLLLNILPATIVKRVGRKKGAVAERYEMVSVLFADIVNFTTFAETTTPQRLVDLLHKLFTRFDLLTEKYHCEKIKTIGDAYMVSAGVPDRRSDHALCTVRFAQAMLREVEAFNEEEEVALTIRIGIHSGPVVAGVIGEKKFSYDLWGDTVNTASRMESSGIPYGIQITEVTAKLLDGHCQVRSRGKIQIKGKGIVETFFVE